MLERLNSICERYEELSRLLCDPEVIGDPERLRKVSKEQADLEEIYRAACEYRKVLDQLDEARSMLEEKLDSEMREWVREEIDGLSGRKEQLEERIRFLLLPKDPNYEKNVIVEIRAAAGGEEAPFLPPTFSGCIPASPKGKVGKRRSWI